MKHPDVIRLEALFGKYPAARSRLLPIDATPMPGQIWSIAGASAQVLFGEVVLLGRLRDEYGVAVVEAAPLVHDATLAGPMDYILPENVFCHHAAALLGLSFSLPQRKLGACMGTIEESLRKDMLAHCDKAQANELDPGECHAPDYFDTHDARYRFHEEAAGQIAALQKELYQWLDQLEQSGEGKDRKDGENQQRRRRRPAARREGMSREDGVIQAAHLFKEVAPVYGMAAAGEGAPDSLKEFDLAIRLDGQLLRLTVRQSRKQGFLAMVLHGDRESRCAQVLSENGKKLADIVHGEARLEWTGDIGGALILADADRIPLVKINVQ